MLSNHRQLYQTSAVIVVGGVAIYLCYRFWEYLNLKDENNSGEKLLVKDEKTKSDISIKLVSSITLPATPPPPTRSIKKENTVPPSKENGYKSSKRYRMKRDKKTKKRKTAIHVSSNDTSSSSNSGKT